MRDLTILLVHLLTTIFRLARPGGLRSVVAESVLIEHQFIIVNRSRRRVPKPPRPGSADRRILFPVDKADSPIASCNRGEAIGSIEFLPRSGAAKISDFVFAEAPDKVWAERPNSGSHSCRCPK
jgi:hypothetical protein